MKIATSTIGINPGFPINQAGFIQQVNPIFEFHDDLQARIVAFDDGNSVSYHISLDSLGVGNDVQEHLRGYLQKKSDRPINLTLSSTHTHFAADASDVRYQSELFEKLECALDTLYFIEYDNVTVSYRCMPFEEVGTSRISNHEAIVLLQLFTIAVDNKPTICMIVHNCHPTILDGNTPYFSSEYPGYVIQELSQLYPDIYFTFIQGAAGDVSTRFTRSTQDYTSVVSLGNKLVSKVGELLNEETECVEFNKVAYDYVILEVEHEFDSIDISNLPSTLSPRELETIRIGVEVRDNLSKKLDTLDKQVMISKLGFGPYTLVFCPNEVFSSYINCIDSTKSALGCYSNGYSPYMTGIKDDFITYEKFTDTYTMDTKKKYIKILESFGK